VCAHSTTCFTISATDRARADARSNARGSAKWFRFYDTAKRVTTAKRVVTQHAQHQTRNTKRVTPRTVGTDCRDARASPLARAIDLVRRDDATVKDARDARDRRL